MDEEVCMLVDDIKANVFKCWYKIALLQFLKCEQIDRLDIDKVVRTIIEYFSSLQANFECFNNNNEQIIIMAMPKDIDTDKLFAYIQTQVAKTIIICVSNVFSCMKGIEKAHDQALKAIKYRIILTNKNGIQFCEIENDLKKDMKLSYYEDDLKKIIMMIESTHISDLEILLCKVYNEKLIEKGNIEYFERLSEATNKIVIDTLKGKLSPNMKEYIKN